MTDPRNIAHDKKVEQEKKHHGIVSAHEHSPLGKKPRQAPHPASPAADTDDSLDKAEPAKEP